MDLQKYYTFLQKHHQSLDISKQLEEGLTTFSIKPQQN